MTVAFVGEKLGTSSSSSSTAAVNLSAYSVGDLAFVFISAYYETLAPPTVPSGWTLLQETTASSPTIALYYKTLTAEDLTTLTWTFSDSGNKVLVHASVYSGHDAEAPIDTSNIGVRATGNSTPVDYGDITTDCPMIVVFGVTYATNAVTFGAVQDHASERYDYGHTTPDLWQHSADSNGGWAGGTSDPAGATSANGYYSIGCHVAISPAGGAPADTPDLFLDGVWG